MEQYISKSALLAEIERIKKENYYDTHDEYDGFVRNALDKFLSFIDTLEVKEIGVDVGSSEGDWGSKTVQFIDANGNIKEITFNKAQKGEQYETK